jgi:hypothetical protein
MRGMKSVTSADYLRRSPRIKERHGNRLERVNYQPVRVSLSSNRLEDSRKLTVYRITDTPIHKQTHSRIAARQQKIIKRISFQKNNSSKTFIPDTPDKSKKNFSPSSLTSMEIDLNTISKDDFKTNASPRKGKNYGLQMSATQTFV